MSKSDIALGLLFLGAAFGAGVNVGDSTPGEVAPKVIQIEKEEILFPGLCKSAINYGLEFDSTHPVQRDKYESLANQCWSQLGYQEKLIATNPDMQVVDHEVVQIPLTEEEEAILFAMEECELDGGNEEYCEEEGFLDYYEGE